MYQLLSRVTRLADWVASPARPVILGRATVILTAGHAVSRTNNNSRKLVHLLSQVITSSHQSSSSRIILVPSSHPLHHQQQNGQSKWTRMASLFAAGEMWCVDSTPFEPARTNNRGLPNCHSKFAGSFIATPFLCMNKQSILDNWKLSGRRNISSIRVSRPASLWLSGSMMTSFTRRTRNSVAVTMSATKGMKTE
jgi:hypothetical protein